MATISVKLPSSTPRVTIVPSGDGVSGSFPAEIQIPELNFADGNGVGQVNRYIRKNHDLTVSGGGTPSVNIDLFDNAGLLDALGRACALTKVKAIIIIVTSSEATLEVELGAEGSAAAWQGMNGSDTVPFGRVQAGCPYVWVNKNGKDVADTTSHLLKIANQSATGTCTVQVFILGSQ